MAGNSVLIITNPTSAEGRGSRTAETVATLLRRRGVEVTVRHTTASGEAEAIAAEAVSRGLQPARSPHDRPSCIVACGGDGTMQEVANGLAGAAPSEPRASARAELCPTQVGRAPPDTAYDCRAKPDLRSAADSRPSEPRASARAESQSDGLQRGPVMGLAPAGRCNDFARALGVPTNPDGIADILTTGKPFAIDLGRVNDRYFCTVATMGADAEVSSYVDSMRLPLKGTLAYLYGALCVLARYRPRRVRIEGDFGVIDQPVFLASSANTCVYGGGIPIAPGASPVDGMLDLCVINEVSRLRLLTLLPAVLLGRHRSCPEVQFVQTKRLSIEATPPLELWADGERIARTPAAIEVVPRAIRILLPSRWAGRDKDRPCQ